MLSCVLMQRTDQDREQSHYNFQGGIVLFIYFTESETLTLPQPSMAKGLKEPFPEPAATPTHSQSSGKSPSGPLPGFLLGPYLKFLGGNLCSLALGGGKKESRGRKQGLPQVTSPWTI